MEQIRDGEAKQKFNTEKEWTTRVDQVGKDQNQPKRQDKLQSMSPQWSRQFFGEVNPLCE